MERTPPVEPEDQTGEADMAAVHLAPADDLEQRPAEDSMSAWSSRHRQCMEILVRQECRRERCEEQLEELKVKLREETQRRIEAEAKVTRLLDIIHSITRGTRVEQLDLEVARLSVRSQVLKENAEKHEEQMRAMVEEKNELKRRYDELLTDSKHLHEENTSLKQKCQDQFKQLEKLHLERLTEGLKEMLRLKGMEEEEWMQETATGSSRAEEAAEESSVLSSEEASNAKDQEGSDSVPMPLNHLPEPVDPALHRGEDLQGKTTEQHRMEDEESLQETAAGSSREEAAEQSSVLSSEEEPHTMDQEEPDSVPTPLNHLPESLDPNLHTGVNLLSSSYLPFGLRAGWLQGKAAAI
ncbi:unnamed protein product [Symbiodinium necroappetens]|uniref:Uncharacterized protein n=1 Tax=Symbiodinium necroappetens TaxID=1628268 RepID=A0A812U7F2_9DINO|nr:unnamed protein product [Symbiodinium necroappetens]